MPTLQQQINKIITRHNAIISEYPDIDQIKWDIKKVPYKEFNEWRNEFNSKLTESNQGQYIEETASQDELWIFIHSWHLKTPKLLIHIASVPVKFKHTIEAVEELVL